LEDEFVIGIAVISCSGFFVISNQCMAFYLYYLNGRVLGHVMTSFVFHMLLKGTIIANNYQLDE
jgi:hypothetical protein